jgi:hypothetical protein
MTSILRTSRLVVMTTALLAAFGSVAVTAQARTSTRSDTLSGVWCVLATRCVAVGGQNAGPLVEAWNGTSWRLQRAPGATGSDLLDVSCTSKSNCIAVGGAAPAVDTTLAEAWNGSTWRITPTPKQPPGSQEYGVSCKGSQCVAIGRSMLAELWRSGKWQRIKVPLPAHFFSGELSDVSCASASFCVAVGFYFTSVRGNSISLAELWNGTRWRLLSPPGGGFGGVSCPSTTFCMAVSSKTAATWNGHRWRQSTIPGAFGNGPGVANVSCVSASACMAIGFYRASGGHNIAKFWNGSKWRTLFAPRPFGLTDVSCTRVSRCMAVGSTQTFKTGARTIAERWNGKTWQLLRTLNP